MRYRLEHRRYALPFRAPVNSAHGPWSVREGVYVRVEDSSGAVGYGEVAPIPWFGTEDLAEALRVLEALGGQIEESVLDSLPAQVCCTLGALRAALSQARGTGPSLPEEKASLRIAALLPAGRAALGRLRELSDAGFRCFKWKVGVGDPADEMSMLEDLLSLLPTGAQLRLDANGAWDTRVAGRWLSRCAGLPIEFVEQPISPLAKGSEDSLLGLASDSPVTLALDESAVTDHQLQQWLAAGWPGIYVVKPSLLADPDSRLREFQKAGARLVFSSALETRLGAQQALRLAFSWKGGSLALGFGVWPLFQDSRFDGPHAAPFIRGADLKTLNPESSWNAAT